METEIHLACNEGMDRLAIEERKKYDKLWTRFPEYRLESPADYLTSVFLIGFQSQIKQGDSVLDFGCGPGRSAPSLLKEGLKVGLVDISENCLDPETFLLTTGPKAPCTFFQEPLWELSSDVKPVEWILCLDVLEHLPEEKVASSLKAMASRMKTGGMFSIGCGKLIGEPLHLTIKTPSWWRAQIRQYFSIKSDFCRGEWFIVILGPLQ